MATFIVLLCILSSLGLIIYRKGKNMRMGKMCSCSCEHCPAKEKCRQ